MSFTYWICPVHGHTGPTVCCDQASRGSLSDTERGAPSTRIENGEIDTRSENVYRKPANPIHVDGAACDLGDLDRAGSAMEAAREAILRAHARLRAFHESIKENSRRSASATTRPMEFQSDAGAATIVTPASSVAPGRGTHREMDMRVAEVMGAQWLLGIGVRSLILQNGLHAATEVGGVLTINPACPHYSRRMADAWMVVEKMRADGYGFDLSSAESDGGWSVLFDSQRTAYRKTSRCAATAPLAICLAAVACVEAAFDASVPSRDAGGICPECGRPTAANGACYRSHPMPPARRGRAAQ